MFAKVKSLCIWILMFFFIKYIEYVLYVLYSVCVCA